MSKHIENAKYAVYAEEYGVMKLAEDGFDSQAAAAAWAANKYGLGNWRVLPYAPAMALPQEMPILA